MAATVFPPSVQGAGTLKVQFVPVLAVPSAPTLVELNGSAAIDVTPYFRADAFSIAMAQATVDDTRLSDETTRESHGIASFTVDTFRYIYDPQAVSNSPTNLAETTFVEGLSGYFVLRYGTKSLLSGAAWAASQKIGGIYFANFGARHREIPTGDNAVHVITQSLKISRLAETFTLPSS